MEGSRARQLDSETSRLFKEAFAYGSGSFPNWYGNRHAARYLFLYSCIIVQGRIRYIIFLT